MRSREEPPAAAARRPSVRQLRRDAPQDGRRPEAPGEGEAGPGARVRARGRRRFLRRALAGGAARSPARGLRGAAGSSLGVFLPAETLPLAERRRCAPFGSCRECRCPGTTRCPCRGVQGPSERESGNETGVSRHPDTALEPLSPEPQELSEREVVGGYGSRIRRGGLKQEPCVRHPCSPGPTNTEGRREHWQKGKR